MCCEERESFLASCDEEKGMEFNYREEILAYCIYDAMLSSKRNFFLKLVNMDPICEAIIIPSVCQKVARKMLLKDDTVGKIIRGVVEWETADLKTILIFCTFETQQTPFKPG
jgi:hypothetical protein